MSKAIQVFVTDDHPIVRRGLKTLLRSEPEFEFVGEAANGIEAVKKVLQIRPDVILMDLVMPKQDGLTTIEQIVSGYPEARILVLTSFDEADKVLAVFKAGAVGYLLKDSSPEELLQAIRQVYQGNASIHPTIAQKLLHTIKQPDKQVEVVETPLTERETDVLIWVAKGLANQDIANKLVISEWTVRTHVRNIMSKLHLENRTQIALYALREGLTGLEEI
jgi:NarL family two-component system response regulator LiaR